ADGEHSILQFLFRPLPRTLAKTGSCFIHIIQAPAIGSALECKGPGKRLRRRSRRARPGAIQDPPFRISTKAGKDTGEKPENRKQNSEVRRQPTHAGQQARPTPAWCRRLPARYEGDLPAAVGVAETEEYDD